MLGILGITSILVVLAIILGITLINRQSNKLVSLKIDSQVVESQETALAQAKKDILKYSELETIAKQIVPQDKDQAKAAREILSLANQSGVKISSIGFPASSLGQAPPKATTKDTPNITGPTEPTTTETQVKSVLGINGLFQLDITVISDASAPVRYDKLIDFLSKLEQNRRTAQVSQITIQPDAENRSLLNFSLTITLYIKP